MATLILSYTLILLLQVIAGHHLRYGQLGSVTPIVQIEVKGVHADNNIKLTQHCRGCEFYNDYISHMSKSRIEVKLYLV